jgi:hypothetical protein
MKYLVKKMFKNAVKSINLNINKGRYVNKLHPTPTQLWPVGKNP